MRPVNLATEKALRYRKWVDEKRAYVERVSAGRVGYVHMFDMSSASLSQLFVDLDAENQSKEAVVVDVRHNNGGFVNVYAVDVLARKSYLRMTPRGFSTAPARAALGQRALELPTALVTDQYSLGSVSHYRGQCFLLSDGVFEYLYFIAVIFCYERVGGPKIDPKIYGFHHNN